MKLNTWVSLQVVGYKVFWLERTYCFMAERLSQKKSRAGIYE